MTLYYAIWPDKTISIIHAGNHVEAFWILDDEGDPFEAEIWSTDGIAAITSEMTEGGLEFHCDTEHGWTYVTLPSYDKILGGIKIK